MEISSADLLKVNLIDKSQPVDPKENSEINEFQKKEKVEEVGEEEKAEI